MLAKHYRRLFVVPLAMLAAGCAMLAAPVPFRGPLLFSANLVPPAMAGWMVFNKPDLYLADVAGVMLLALATLGVWVIALAWEYRRRICR